MEENLQTVSASFHRKRMEALQLRLEQAEDRAERAEKEKEKLQLEVGRLHMQIKQLEQQQTVQSLQRQVKATGAENGDDTVGANLSGMASVQATVQQQTSVAVGGGNNDSGEEVLDFPIDVGSAQLKKMTEEVTEKLGSVNMTECKETDVVCLQGNRSNHLGNELYMAKVDEYLEQYKNAGKKEKGRIIDGLLFYFRTQKVRFLHQPNNHKADMSPDERSLWVDVGNTEARGKIKNRLSKKS